MAFVRITAYKTDISGVNYGIFDTEDEAFSFMATYVADGAWDANDARVTEVRVLREVA